MAELKCDQEPSTLDVANTLIKRCQSTILMVTATPEGSKGVWGRGQGQLRAFREAVSMRYKTEVGLDHVLMGWMVRQCVWSLKKLQVENAVVLSEARTTLDKWFHLEKFVWTEIIQRMEPN